MRRFISTWRIGPGQHLSLAAIGLALLLAPAMALAEPALDETEWPEWRVLREQGRALEHAEGVGRDYLAAAEKYCQGARKGDPEAAYDLGWMYANGRGLPRDDGIAAAFFRRALEQGHEPSRRVLNFISTPPSELPPCMRSVESAAEEFVARGPLELLIHQLAPEYGIHPGLALAIARTESNLNPEAVSAKNAQGVMQLIPETSVRFNVRKPFDPEQNIRGGLAYLRWLLAYFKGDVRLVAAGYNAGEGTVNRYRGVPPYPETRHYVKQILLLFGNNEHPFDASITLPSPELGRILAPQGRGRP